MIHIKLQVETEKVEALMQLLNDSNLVENIEIEEPKSTIQEVVSSPIIPETLTPTPTPVVVETPAVVEVPTAPEIVVNLTDFENTNFKPMTATDFYKKINASNLAQKEKRIFPQNFIEKEVQSW